MLDTTLIYYLLHKKANRKKNPKGNRNGQKQTEMDRNGHINTHNSWRN